MVQQSGTSDDVFRDRILEHYLRRLGAGASRSSLLKVVTGKTAKLLDINRLRILNTALPGQLLATVVGGQEKVTLDLRDSASPGQDNGSESEPLQRIFDLLQNRMRGHAEQAKRETGVHALWLGYPLLLVRAGEGDSERWILSPVYLWPVDVDRDSRQEKHIRIRRCRDPEDPQFNQGLAVWIRRELGITLEAPKEEELLDFNRATLENHLGRLAQQLSITCPFNLDSPLQAVPQQASVPENRQLIPAAVIGYFRWYNEAIQADLQSVRDRGNARGVLRGLLSPSPLPQPGETPPPPEEDRYLVYPADFSQERVIWQVRLGPGLVMHGPPGTGKSQTIVNIIADHLARGQTVLMVCQKQAATRVVLERLRAVGLADLCMEVQDAEQDRRKVFQDIRAQVENLPATDEPSSTRRERQELAVQITALEAELDRHARALHQKHPRFGISYRDMEDREQQAIREFATVRPVAALKQMADSLTIEKLEEMLSHVRQVGSWFRESDALNNPWRFGQLDNLQLSSLLRNDVANLMEELRQLDARHQEHIRQHGAGMPLPLDLKDFAEVAREVLQIFPSAGTSLRIILLRWLTVLVAAPPEQQRDHLRQCQLAVDLAGKIHSGPLDGSWRRWAETTPGFLEQARKVVHYLTSPEASLVLSWLRALRGASPQILQEKSAKCQQAEELARQVVSQPLDASWLAVERQTPNFLELATALVDRLEALTAQPRATSHLLLVGWLKALGDTEESRVQAELLRCRQAVDLSQRVEAAQQTAEWIRQAANQTEFAGLANQVAQRLKSFRQFSGSQKNLMIRTWLRRMRRASPTEFTTRFEECRQAAELARQVLAIPLDAEWHRACDKKITPAQCPSMLEQLEGFRRQSKGWIISWFATGGAKFKQMLLQLRPGASDHSLPMLAETLLTYIKGCQLGEELKLCNRRLLIEHVPPATDVAAQALYPALVEETLTAAEWLIRTERQHLWCVRVIDDFLASETQSGPDEEALRSYVDGLEKRRQLQEIQPRLVPGIVIRLEGRDLIKYPSVALKALEEANQLIQQERTIPWVRSLVTAWLQRQGPEQTVVLRPLKEYLRRRQLRAQMIQTNRELIPNLVPTPEQARSPEYAKTAREAFRTALELSQLERGQAWIPPLLQECLAGPGASSPLLKSLEGFLALLQQRQQLAVSLGMLVPDLPAPTEETARQNFPREALEGLQRTLRLLALAEKCRWLQPVLQGIHSTERSDGHIVPLKDLETSLRRFSLVKELTKPFTQLNHLFHGAALQQMARTFCAGGTILSWIESVEKGLSRLPALLNLHYDRKERSGPLKEMLRTLENHELELAAGKNVPRPDRALDFSTQAAWWVALVNCSVMTAWQDRCHEDCPELLRLTLESHETKVRQLANLLERKRLLEAEHIREVWRSRQLWFRNEEWRRMFQERTSKRGPAKRLREAVEESWDHGLKEMRPCWLVNPASSSQIFPLLPEQFDLVIFDEASQCPIEQAIPAIYRGKRLVVSGDEKQLPPTTFFSAASEGDEDDEGAEAEANDAPAEVLRQRRLRRASEEFLLEVEDLLGAAIGKLKQLYLAVHYRSDHPALIDFSNRAFYQGQLEAPPGRHLSIEGVRPIELHPVGGCYANRTNQEEARHVVDLLRRMWQANPSAPSVGVVTFNQAQRELIEKLLQQAGNEDALFNQRLADESNRRENNQDLGFFVKNLENVQGDERDIMIFSTTFGPDAQNRFQRRFGPVGVEGGHRRLNVAITRARRRIIIVGSMPIPQIASALTTGARESLSPAGYLQLYLAYAEAISAGNEQASQAILNRLGQPRGMERLRPDGPTTLEMDLMAVLRGWKYTTHPHVGDSGFRINLAVPHPDQKKGYLLGIECDGGVWFSDRSARIRDVWRRRILADRGWKLHRVWSTRWWGDREAEMRRLQAALTSALAGA